MNNNKCSDYSGRNSRQTIDSVSDDSVWEEDSNPPMGDYDFYDVIDVSETRSYMSFLTRASHRRRPAFVQVANQIEEEFQLRDRETIPWTHKVWTFMQYYCDVVHYIVKKTQWKLSRLGLPWVAREEEVSEQATVLCKEFIYAKLKRLGYLGGNQKYGLRGTRGQKISAVCREVQLIGTELERLYPTLYKDITKQLNMNLSSEQIVEQVLFDIGDALFKTGITWAKVVALFVISSSLSIECFQQGNGIFVHTIAVSLTRYVHSNLARWISQRGGWVDLLRTFRRKRNDSHLLWVLTVGGIFIGFLFTVFASRATYFRMWPTKVDLEQ